MRTCKLHGRAEGVHAEVPLRGAEVCRAQRAVRAAILATTIGANSTHGAHRVVAHVGERNELARAPAVYLVEINVVAHLALC